MIQEYSIDQKPSKLMPVLIGAAAMTATAVIPLVNAINCLCCAGIMGGAVLGVWFYKKSFPEDMTFRVSDGAVVGTFSGMIGAVLTSVIETLTMGFSGELMTEQIESQLEQAFDQAAQQGSDPAAIEAVQQFITTMMTNPIMMFIVVLLGSLFVFTGFGALGGVIGGNIFKSKTPVQPQ
jgi:putative copper export protein